MSDTRSKRLETWKAIARYLDRSVRTVRRWETNESLPVHRQMHQSQASVYAWPAELDAWEKTRTLRPADPVPVPIKPSDPNFGQHEAASVAVLPMEFLGPDKADEYLADGLTDEIITGLSKVPALRVISRTSIMTLKHSEKNARKLAEQLQVSYLLEGSVRRSGDRLRVSVRLIDPENDSRLWAERYDSTLDAVFDIQARIASEIASALQIELSLDDKRLIADTPIDNIVAWQCAVQARQEALRWREDAIDGAVMRLERALSLTGNNIHLMAALGRAHLQYCEAGIRLDDEPLRRAGIFVDQIFQMDANSPHGFELRGWLHYAQARISDAISDLKTALDGLHNAPDSLALLAYCFLLSGRVSQARPLVERLLAIDPLTPLTRCMPGTIDIFEGRRKEAMTPYREMFELDPGNPIGRLFYIWILILNGQAQTASDLAKGFSEEHQQSPSFELSWLLIESGKGETSDGLADPSAKLQAVAEVNDVFSRILAHAYAISSDPERASYWLAAAMKRGFINYPFVVEHDPDFSALAGNDVFDELTTRMQQQWEAFAV